MRWHFSLNQGQSVCSLNKLNNRPGLICADENKPNVEGNVLLEIFKHFFLLLEKNILLCWNTPIFHGTCFPFFFFFEKGIIFYLLIERFRSTKCFLDRIPDWGKHGLIVLRRLPIPSVSIEIHWALENTLYQSNIMLNTHPFRNVTAKGFINKTSNPW